jgi:hypothetical protein
MVLGRAGDVGCADGARPRVSTPDGLRIGTPTLRATRQSRPGHHPHRSPDQDTTPTGSRTILLPPEPNPDSPAFGRTARR